MGISGGGETCIQKLLQYWMVNNKFFFSLAPRLFFFFVFFSTPRSSIESHACPPPAAAGRLSRLVFSHDGFVNEGKIGFLCTLALVIANIDAGADAGSEILSCHQHALKKKIHFTA